MTTGKMGNIRDPTAVVDSRGRVIGVNALRIADASVFANLPPGHPLSTVCKSILSFLFQAELISFRYGSRKDYGLYPQRKLVDSTDYVLYENPVSI